MGGFLGGYIVYIETAKRRRSVKFCVCVCVCTRRKTAGIYDIRGEDAICNTGSIMSQRNLEEAMQGVRIDDDTIIRYKGLKVKHI